MQDGYPCKVLKSWSNRTPAVERGSADSPVQRFTPPGWTPRRTAPARHLSPLALSTLVFLVCHFFLLFPGLAQARGVREVKEPRIEETSPLSDTPLPRDPLLVQGTLPNGIRYYIRRNVRPANRAELRLVVRAGSVLEEEDQRGLAHFVEHLAFNGTARFPKNSLIDWLESIGMRFGPETNAYTSFDETVYQLEVPLDTPDILDTAFKVLFDWAFQITFAPEEVDKERGVILEEWRLGRGASSRVRDKQYPVLWQGSRYAERLPIGIPEVIQRATAQDLRRFYATWYRPDLMAIVAVGDFHPAEVESKIREAFSPAPAIPALSLPAPSPNYPSMPALPAVNQWGETRSATPPGETSPRSPERPLFQVPDHEETLFSAVMDPELPYSSVGVYVKRDHRATQTFREFREDLIEQIFFSIINTRFSDLSRKPGAPFLFAGAGTARPIGSKKLFYLSASAEEGKILGALEGLLIEVRRIQLHGASEGEVNRAKAEILRQAEQRAKEQHTINSSSFVRSYVDAFLRQTPTLGPEYAFRTIRRLLPSIEPREVASLADAFLSSRNRVVLISAPEKERNSMPSEKEALEVLAKAEKATPAPLEEEAVVEHLLQGMEPPAGGILERIPSARGSIPARYSAVEWRLGNGMRVILKPTDFKADEILFSAFSLGGTSLAEDPDFFSARFAPDVIEQSGLGRYGASQLEKYLSGKVVSLTPRIDEVAFRFNGSSSKKDLETFFQLLYLYFTAPRYDEEAVRRYMDQVRTSLRKGENSPEERYSRLIQETIRGGHPRSLPLTADRLDQVDPLRAFLFYRAFTSRPDTYTFVFVGSLQPEELEPFLRRYLAAIPPGTRETDQREVARDKAPSGDQSSPASPIPRIPTQDLGQNPPGQQSFEPQPRRAQGPIDPSRVGTIVDRGTRFPEKTEERVLKAGKEQKSLVTLYFTGLWDFSLEEMVLLNLVEDYLDIRLREVLREDRGGTYGVNVTITPRRAPVPEYSIEVSFGTAPGRVRELLELVRAELNRLKTTLPAEGDVAKVREQRLRLSERGQRENGFWRLFLTQELYYEAVDAQLPRRASFSHLPPRVSASSEDPPIDAFGSGTLFDLWEQVAKALSPAILQERVRRYFDEGRLLTIILVPEENP